MDQDAVKSLENHLNMLIETSRQIGITASNFQEPSQNALNKKLSELSKCLRNLDMMKDNFDKVNVPISVFK